MNKEQAREHAARMSALENLIREDGFDSGVVSRRQDVHYLSGYTGSDAILLFTLSKRPQRLLLTDQRYTEEAERSAPGWETVVWKKGMFTNAGALLRKWRSRRIGYSPASTSVLAFEALRESAGSQREYGNMDGRVSSLRAVKSAFEIACVEKAVDCAHAAFLAAKQRWKAGMTEREVKNDLEWEMRRRGAEDAAFETIVASGANASLPHAHAGDRPVADGRMLLIDFGARVRFYNSDCTRTLWPGGVPRRWRKRYQSVLAAQCAALAKIAAGASCALPDAAARAVLAEAGLEEYFTHGLGHGVGLEVHEQPRLGRRAKARLVAGNVVTVEPGVYFPGSGGIRIEDMALTTADGVRILGALPKDVEAMAI